MNQQLGFMVVGIGSELAITGAVAQALADILHDAVQTLTAAGVSYQENYREGDIAEQLGCKAIVFPLPHARIANLLSPDVVREVIKRAKAVPVVTTDEECVDAKAMENWL
ncbi:hypothetical protein [Candidatus Accumulibacter sp. ACC003]|uniref:hypothetical protein n=1 Tax=Candidatus Accumulibacter sp. ACC003 TaxID=2823334 RepID=UPI0025BE1C22|nr:hypothetical protein [Candidatus Accumulibacter sp. ACC003]